MAEDPVCEMQVDENEARERGLTTEYHGRTYYFCSPGCKQQFDKDPHLFVARKPELE